MLIKVHMRTASGQSVSRIFCWISSFIADTWNFCWHSMHTESQPGLFADSASFCWHSV